MSEALAEAIRSGDAAALQGLLAEQPALVNKTIRWGEEGKNGSVPLHFVSDMQFEGVLAPEEAKPIVEALLLAGADINAPHERHGDTPLIGAASLYAEETGLRLVAAGADVRARGLFGATALHWAAHCGLDRLAGALIGAGAEIVLPDEKYGGAPADWAYHGWSEGGERDRRGRQPRVAALLARAGADVERLLSEDRDPDWRADLRAALA